MNLRETLAHRHVVLTGFTGFLGKVFAVMLLEEVPSIRRVTLVVRPKGKRVSALSRVERAFDTSPAARPLRALHGAGLGAFLGDRIEVVSGDVETPRFGLDRPTLDALRASQVDAVIHCAGLTDFMPDPGRALRANVLGAKHAADIASFLRAPLIHISTCFVAGNVSGTIGETLEAGVAPNGESFDVVEEIGALGALCVAPEASADRELRMDRAMDRAQALGWPNIYCYTKALAEHLLATRSDVPITIVRPAIVECARTYPFPGWNEGLNTAGPLAWLISTAFRHLPTRGDHIFDVVPVDDVARGMLLTLAAVLKGERPEVVQLASGDANPLRFERAVELTGLGFRRWVRQTGGTPADRLFRWLDPVPASTEKPGPLPVPRLKRWVSKARSWAVDLQQEQGSGSWVHELAGQAVVRMDEAGDALERIETMLDLYRPFIEENRYLFQTDQVRAWSDALSVADRDLAWGVPEIDWCHYWVDIEYPGLATWCMPVMRGEEPPLDAPSTPPLSLTGADHSQTQAGK